MFVDVRFNPLPLPKQGEILASATVPFAKFEFQSAPPAEARGDLGTAYAKIGSLEFQSAPCAFYLFIRQPHGSEVSPTARNTLDSARIPRASKLLICGLFQKGRVLAQDGELPRKGWPCSCSVSAHVFRERRLVVRAYAVGSSKSNIV